MALYMLGFITYGATLVFYSAIFPRLARNTPQCRELRELYEAGQIDTEEYELEESLKKNRVSNISTVSLHPVFEDSTIVNEPSDAQQHRICCHSFLNLTLLLPLARHPLVDNYTIVMCILVSSLLCA
jgi:hypothetical protein